MGKIRQLREQVAKRIGEAKFASWFGDSTTFRIDDERVSVEVPSAFIGSWITSNYLQQIVEAASAVLGVELQVDIIVRNGAAKPSPVSNSAAQSRATAGSAAPRPPRAPRAVLKGELETFVVGPSNELAYRTACDLVETLREIYRPLVLHGPPGLGKTHLLHAIANAISRKRPLLHWAYTSGEQFTNDYIAALRNDRIEAFRARCRNVEVLLIDDIHFLADKHATQMEFLHTFNAIEASGKAVVLTSDRHPRSVGAMSDALINRLVSGVVVEIQPPDFETRKAIIQRRAEIMHASLPDEVVELVARRVTQNVRELEGALNKIVALATMQNQPIDIALAHRAVADAAPPPGSPAAAEIERVVYAYFGVSRGAVHSRSRARNVTIARTVATYLLRLHTSMSFPEIARALGSNNHTTALMANRRFEQLLESNGAVAWTTSSGIQEEPARSVLDRISIELTKDAARRH